MRPIERIRRICGLWLLLLLPAAIMAQGYDYTIDFEDEDGFCYKKAYAYGGREGVLDMKGRVILPVRFKSIISLCGGFITKLKESSSEGFYTRTGKCVIPHERDYDDLYSYDNSLLGYLFVVKKGEYMGICDGKGNEIIKPDKYTYIAYTDLYCPSLENGEKYPFFRVATNEKHGICDVAGNEIIPPICPLIPELTQEKNRWKYYAKVGKLCYIDAQREPSDYNPFKENRVESEEFYADFGGEETPNSLIPLPTAPSSEERLAETDTEEDESVEELVAEAKALTKTLNDLTAQAQGTSGSSDAGKTRRPTVAEVVVDTEPYDENDRLADDESFVKRLIRNNRSGDAFGYLQAELKDDYPSDPNVQFGYATLLQELGIALNNEGMAAAYSLNLAKAAVATSQIQAAKTLQIQLFGTAAIKGHQGAQLMLQVMGAAAKSYSAPASSVPSYDNNNNDYKPSLIQVEEVCDFCHGTGKIRTKSVVNYGGNAGQFTDEICPSCGGTGKIKRLRNNPDL